MRACGREPELSAEDTFALHCKNLGLHPEREVRFHPVRRWRFDFAFPDERVAVEIEGGTWAAGRHTRGAGFRADCEKYNTAALRGWTVLRYTTDMIYSGCAISEVQEALR